MKKYSGLKITNIQSFFLNFIIGVSIVHVGIYSMNVIHQLGVVNSIQLMLAIISIALGVITVLKKVVLNNFIKISGSEI
jgi:hypothetical protein